MQPASVDGARKTMSTQRTDKKKKSETNRQQAVQITQKGRNVVF